MLLARAAAWCGHGVRTPVRRALLAGSVTPETYGRAFGFERMMDMLGATVGPATALLLLPLVAIEETLEDSLCAELVGAEHHGMGFGVLAHGETVNGVGDFVSSPVVGVLWTAFGYSAVLFAAGAVLVARLRGD